MSTEDLDALLNEAIANLPAPKARASSARPPSIGPALPTRTQHHSPFEAESVFVRYAAWWNEFECSRCQHTWRHFDGLFEERDWLDGHLHPTAKHWLKAVAMPIPELLKNAVSLVRFYRTDMCECCTGADKFPQEGRMEP